MIITILIFTIIGILLGLIAGLLPGIHPNQLFILIIGFLPFFSGFPTESLLALIVSVMVSNIFFNYIPAIFFSVPDPNTVLNVLPGHKMVLEGKGLDALFISLSGGLLTLITCCLFLPLALILIPVLNKFLYPHIHILLIGLTFWLLLLESNWKKRLLSFLLFLLSGFWGILCLNSKLINSEDVLFPALTGMFGIAGLVTSLEEGVKIPTQKVSKNIKTGSIFKIVLTGLTAGLLIGVLPGAGESQAGILVSNLTRIGEEEFLGSLAGINTSNSIFALISLYSFGKVRSGAAAAIDSIIPHFNLNYLFLCIAIILLSSGLSVILCWLIGKKFLKALEKINYRIVSMFIIVFTTIMVLFFTGFIGLFILLVSTCLGLLPIIWGVRRTSNMGFLMLSTIIYFSGLTWTVNWVLF
ncbi:MAG: tripartite tricarboxylate transporter permease [Candidatus Aenigmatarchaeota archaeon]